MNNAICSSTTTGYLCTCLPGFTGRTCEVTISACASTPCRNSGLCYQVSPSSGYTCTCLNGMFFFSTKKKIKIIEIIFFSIKGWTGTNCQIAINFCANNPCLNSGICSQAINTYNCTCPSAWTGPNCEINVNECLLVAQPCRNGGICRDQIGG